MPISMKTTNWKSYFIPKLKFAGSGAIATSIDYTIYMVLVQSLEPAFSNIISYSLAVLVNFVMQKKFIFTPKRKTAHALVISVVFSIVGLFFSTLLIYIFNEMLIFNSNQYIIKLLVTGIVFFYNFYTKRFAFENR